MSSNTEQTRKRLEDFLQKIVSNKQMDRGDLGDLETLFMVSSGGDLMNFDRATFEMENPIFIRANAQTPRDLEKLYFTKNYFFLSDYDLLDTFCEVYEIVKQNKGLAKICYETFKRAKDILDMKEAREEQEELKDEIGEVRNRIRNLEGKRDDLVKQLERLIEAEAKARPYISHISDIEAQIKKVTDQLQAEHAKLTGLTGEVIDLGKVATVTSGKKASFSKETATAKTKAPAKTEAKLFKQEVPVTYTAVKKEHKLEKGDKAEVKRIVVPKVPGNVKKLIAHHEHLGDLKAQMLEQERIILEQRRRRQEEEKAMWEAREKARKEREAGKKASGPQKLKLEPRKLPKSKENIKISINLPPSQPIKPIPISPPLKTEEEKEDLILWRAKKIANKKTQHRSVPSPISDEGWGLLVAKGVEKFKSESRGLKTKEEIEEKAKKKAQKNGVATFGAEFEAVKEKVMKTNEKMMKLYKNSKIISDGLKAKEAKSYDIVSNGKPEATVTRVPDQNRIDIQASHSQPGEKAILLMLEQAREIFIRTNLKPEERVITIKNCEDDLKAADTMAYLARVMNMKVAFEPKEILEKVLAVPDSKLLKLQSEAGRPSSHP